MEAASDCECSEVGICPFLRRRGSVAGQPPEVVVKRRRLFKEADSCGEELVIGLPCLALSQNVAAHDRGRGEQTKQADLGKTAEEQLGFVETLKPALRVFVMDMAGRGESQPYVDIRENQ